MKKNHTRVLLVILSILLAGCGSVSRAESTTSGEVDLSNHNFDQGEIFVLDNSWEFYWGQLLDSDEIELAAPDGAFPVPGSWSSIKLDNQSLPRDGFLTLHLKVKLPAGNNELALYIPSFNTAYKVWANGELLAKSGEVGESVSVSSPAGFGQKVEIKTESDTLDIVVQASSYEGVPGGPIDRFRLGSADAIATWDYQQTAIDFFVASACFLIGLFYLSLYILRRKERAYIWFALFAGLIALRNLFVGHEVIHLILPGLQWTFAIHMIFFTGQLATAFFVAFVDALYPEDGSPRVARTLVIAGSIAALSLFFTPPSVPFGPLGILYNGLAVASILYCAWVGVTAARRQRPGAFLLILSSLPLVLAIGVELLGSLRIIPPYNLAGFGVLGTIAAQTFTLLRIFTRSVAAVEALSIRLDHTNKAYYRFVPRELLQLIGKDDIVNVQLGDQSQREMTVLFADVRGFTSLSESMSPEKNFQFINQYLGKVSPIIREHNGFIDKYMGDGIMALFPGEPVHALLAAVGMCRSLNELNAERTARGEAEIRIGVGLHLGKLMLGTVGESERMDGTVIADAVNTASRLESISKRYKVTIIISEQTLEAIPNRADYGIRTLGKIRVKGKVDPTVIYEVFDGDKDETANLKRETKLKFESALGLYQAGNFKEAAHAFKQVADSNPTDGTAVNYAQWSQAFVSKGAPENWDGVDTLTEK